VVRSANDRVEILGVMSEAVAFRLRSAIDADRGFLIEMAREACALEGRHPVPPADDPEVVALLPDSDDAVVVAEHKEGRLLGAAWWIIREPPLVSGADAAPLPEMAMAVVEDQRGKGIGNALIEALAERASHHFPALTLHVHLLNPAVRLYARTGFRVAGAGRGWFGVAMIRALGPAIVSDH
jgi:GNAT superfamily N-acetyltransferase